MIVYSFSPGYSLDSSPIRTCTHLQRMAASEYNICLLQGKSYVSVESQDEQEELFQMC